MGEADSPIKDVIIRTIPFVIAMFIMIIIILFPDIALWLPNNALGVIHVAHLSIDISADSGFILPKALVLCDKDRGLY